MPITGRIGDSWGLQDAMHAQAALGATTFVLAWLLPSESRIRELRGES